MSPTLFSPVGDQPVYKGEIFAGGHSRWNFAAIYTIRLVGSGRETRISTGTVLFVYSEVIPK